MTLAHTNVHITSQVANLAAFNMAGVGLSTSFGVFRTTDQAEKAGTNPLSTTRFKDRQAPRYLLICLN